MSSLIRKGKKQNDDHLKKAFVEPTFEDKKKAAYLRVEEDVRDDINAIVQVQGLGKVNELLKGMLQEHKAGMTKDELEKVELVKSLKK